MLAILAYNIHLLAKSNQPMVARLNLAQVCVVELRAGRASCNTLLHATEPLRNPLRISPRIPAGVFAMR